MILTFIQTHIYSNAHIFKLSIFHGSFFPLLLHISCCAFGSFYHTHTHTHSKHIFVKNIKKIKNLEVEIWIFFLVRVFTIIGPLDTIRLLKARVYVCDQKKKKMAAFILFQNLSCVLGFCLKKFCQVPADFLFSVL